MVITPALVNTPHFHSPTCDISQSRCKTELTTQRSKYYQKHSLAQLIRVSGLRRNEGVTVGFKKSFFGFKKKLLISHYLHYLNSEIKHSCTTSLTQILPERVQTNTATINNNFHRKQTCASQPSQHEVLCPGSMIQHGCFRHHDPDITGKLGIDLRKVWITLEETENNCVCLLVHQHYVTLARYRVCVFAFNVPTLTLKW